MSLYDKSLVSSWWDFVGYRTQSEPKSDPWIGGYLFTVTDLKDKDKPRSGYKITCDMPGVRKENVKVTVSSSGVVTVDAKRLDTSGLAVKTYHFKSTGIYSGEKVIGNGIVSQLRDGVLTIVVPVRQAEDEGSVSIETT